MISLLILYFIISNKEMENYTFFKYFIINYNKIFLTFKAKFINIIIKD